MGFVSLLVHRGQRPLLPTKARMQAQPTDTVSGQGDCWLEWLTVNAGAQRASYWAWRGTASALFVCIVRKIAANGQRSDHECACASVCVSVYSHYCRYSSLRKVSWNRGWSDMKELVRQISEKTASAKALGKGHIMC